MKIISGGQTGVDQAALRAAKRCGLQTGGFLPSGCMTLEGERSEFLTEYGMVEHAGGYRERTDANVAAAEFTIRIAKSFSTAGEKCTLDAIKRHYKPYKEHYLDLPVSGFGPEMAVKAVPSEVAFCIGCYEVVNVAGNSEQSACGIGKVAEAFLISVFSLLRERSYGTANLESS